MNKIFKCVCCALFVGVYLSAGAQSIQKSFEGSWGHITWTFEFYSDNTYYRSSSGHFGETEQQGVYEMHGDTIKLITGSKQVDGMENSSYLLQDGSLLDLQIAKGDAVLRPGINFYNSQEILPVPPSNKRESIVTFDFDQTQVFVKWNDFINVLTKKNEIYADANKYTWQNETLKIDWFGLYKAQSQYETFINFREELFQLIDSKKASIYLDGTLIKEFYTKKKTTWSHGKHYLEYKGIQYFDKATKRHLLNNTLFSNPHGGCPSF